VIGIADSYGLSDTGRQRQVNEDSLLLESPLFAVADGMGGAKAGEVASKIAASVLQSGEVKAATASEDLRTLALLANKRINSQARISPEQDGMGTTLTGVYIDKQQESATVVHVGDSRIYLFRSGQLRRITEDHSLVEELIRRGQLTAEEAEVHPQRSIITRALGPEPEVQVDVVTVDIQKGDLLLLCSDGLTTMLSDLEITSTLQQGGSVKTIAQALVDSANKAGGRDNITVALVQMEGVSSTTDTETGVEKKPAASETNVSDSSGATVDISKSASKQNVNSKKKRSGSRQLLKYLVVSAIVLSPVVIGGAFATRAVYFVGSDDGFVTLYQGVPYDLPLGMHLYQVSYKSGISTSLIGDSRRQEILDHRLRSYDDATDLIRAIERDQIVEKR